VRPSNIKKLNSQNISDVRKSLNPSVTAYQRKGDGVPIAK
jgi:hypothetical protein